MSKYTNSIAFHIVYSELVQAATSQKLTNYSAIAKAAGLPPTGHALASSAGEILELVSNVEHAAGRPMLTALCVSAGGKPGPGFFGLAKRLGKLTDSSESEMEFWMKEVQQVYQTWTINR